MSLGNGLSRLAGKVFRIGHLGDFNDLMLVATLGGISLMQTGKEMETMIIVLLVYLLCSLFISLLMNIYNRSIKIKDR